MYHMKTATVRDLRNNFARVSAWISSGQEVEITKRGEVMARLVPVTSVKRKKKHDWAQGNIGWEKVIGKFRPSDA
jgi:prevent-host-death family protein